jgi:hypothetical protein
LPRLRARQASFTRRCRQTRRSRPNTLSRNPVPGTRNPFRETPVEEVTGWAATDSTSSAPFGRSNRDDLSGVIAADRRDARGVRPRLALCRPARSPTRSTLSEGSGGPPTLRNPAGLAEPAEIFWSAYCESDGSQPFAHRNVANL